MRRKRILWSERRPRVVLKQNIERHQPNNEQFTVANVGGGGEGQWQGTDEE